MTVNLTPDNDRPPVDPAPDTGDVPASGTQLGDVPDVEVVTEVDEAKVRRVLSVIGMGAHLAVGDPRIDEHWAFTEGELDALTPPLTGYINRSARLRAAVERGDVVTIAVTLGLYAKRNVDISREIADVDADLETVDVEPVDGDDPSDIQPWGSV